MSLALRQIDGGADQQAAKPRYAWHRGSIQPFSSLWIIVTRFALLNRPRPCELIKDLRGTKHAREATTLRLDGRATWPDHEYVDLQFLSRALREPLDAFRWSSVGDFPAGLQELFSPNVAICPACMAEAFHTVLFSLHGMSVCPVHRVGLLRNCPDCGREMPNRVAGVGIHAPVCRCRIGWIDEAQARRPRANPRRDQVLGSIVDWIEDKGARFWTYAPGWHSRGLDFGALRHHFLLWADEAYEQYPQWLEGGKGPLGRREDAVRCIEHSGHRFHDLVRVPVRRRPSSGMKGHEINYIGLGPRTMFKCIRRYVLRHVLGGHLKLLMQFDRLENFAMWPRMLTEDARALMALAFLLWSQSSYWGESEWAWLQRTVGGVDREVPRRWGRTVLYGDDIRPDSHPASDWVMDWLYASDFLNLWPSEREVHSIVADSARLLTSFHCVRRDHLEWWAWLGPVGDLCLGVYRRRPAWVVARRGSKEERRLADSLRIEQKCLRLQDARDLAGTQALERDENGQWRAAGRLAIDDRVPVKIAGLALGTGGHARAVIAQQQPHDFAPTWVLRCVELPIRQTSTDLVSGMAKLKVAVREYRRLRAGRTGV